MAKKNIVLIRNAQAYDIGGGERFPVLLASVLKENEFYPTIISRSPALLEFAREKAITTVKGWWWSQQNWSGIRILLTPIYFFWQIILYVYYVVQFIRLNPEVVHIQSKDDFIAATLAARTVGAKVIWTDHADLKHIWRNLSIWYKNPIGKVIYLCGFLTRFITVVSKSERQLIIEGLSPTPNARLSSRLKVIYNGAFDVHNKPMPRHPKEVIYIATSRLVIDKGIVELINAFLEINKTHSNTRLWLIGEGRDRKKFEEMSASKSIEFLGQQKDPFTYLERATIFVQPTYHEGFSLSVVEAAMMGLPIIATAVGGNPEIVTTEETGLLVSPRDTEQLRVAMERLYEDEELRELLGSRARQQYERRFNFENNIAPEFMSLYTI